MESPNLLAVLVAGIIPMILGSIWYSRLAFGVKWMALVGKTEEEIIAESKGKELQMYGGTFLASLVMAYVLAHVIQAFSDAYGFDGAWAGIQAGFWSWLGFVITISLQTVVFEFRKPALWIMNGAYNLICLIAMGALLGVWR